MESKKKEEQLQLLHQNQKFFTSMTKVDQAIIANNEIPKVIPVNQQEIKKEVTNEDEGDKDDKSIDSEYQIFIEKNKNKENKKEEEIENKDDELLSSLSNESNEQEEAKDFLLAQYEKVHRIRNKWKIIFIDAILRLNGKEYLFDKVVGELDRDW